MRIEVAANTASACKWTVQGGESVETQPMNTGEETYTVAGNFNPSNEKEVVLDVQARRPVAKIVLSSREFVVFNAHGSGLTQEEGFQKEKVGQYPLKAGTYTAQFSAASNSMVWKVACTVSEAAFRVLLATEPLSAFPDSNNLRPFALTAEAVQVWNQCPEGVRMFLSGDLSTGEVHLWPGYDKRFEKIVVNGQEELPFSDIGIYPGHAQLRKRCGIELDAVFGATLRGKETRIKREEDRNSEYNIRKGNFSRVLPEQVLAAVNQGLGRQLEGLVAATEQLKIT